MNFDDIRPYNDAEVPEAIKSMVQTDLLAQIVHVVYPNDNVGERIEKLLAVRTVHELQATFMNDAIKRIVEVTMSSFTYSGLDYLRRSGSYMFVSNHRDITLDAFLLQHLLLEKKGNTSYIVFGDNLLSMPVAADMFRCNKLISMPRGGTPRAFYESLRHLSEYIHHLIETEHHSVWIAQKNGRAKDGIDVTAPAMIKMLALGGGEEPLPSLSSLNIVPVSMSYEWDPCDAMKANELAQGRKGGYVKEPGEDFTSVVTGIVGQKGRVHLAVGKPLSASELVPAQGEDIYGHVANVLDRRIARSYHLMPSNYAAYDMLHGERRHYSRYDTATVRQLNARLTKLADNECRQLMLEMYANPVDRFFSLR